jgi:hypothetical protein
VRLGKRTFVAAALLAVTVALGTSTAADAATGAGGVPILYASQGNVAHTCTVIGSSGEYQGVVCTDLVPGELGSEYWVDGRIEVFCQTNAGVTVQCVSAWVDGVLANGAGENPSIGGQCGDGYPSCSTGRNYYSAGFTYYSPFNCASSTISSTQVWAVAYGSSYNLTGVELPGGHWVWLRAGNDGSNQSTGHYYICP